MPLWYVDPTGALQGQGYNWGNQPPPPPPPTPAGKTIYGYNYGSGAQSVATRQSWWRNRAPMVRQYYTGMLPSTFTLTTATFPEKRACVSFHAGTVGASALASGAGNSTVKSWVESIPAGWTIYLVYFHEVNGHINKGEISGSDYTGAYEQLYPVIQSATLKSGVTVKLVSNFNAYQLTGTPWTDAWVPVGNCDLLTWDLYGNPGINTSASGSNIYGGPATGSGLGTTYPLPATRANDMFKIIERTGFAQAWGILELNAPARDWDTNESGRAKWHQDMLQLMHTPPMKNGSSPDVVLIWEDIGNLWDQRYGKVSGTPHSVADAIAPYFIGSP